MPDACYPDTLLESYREESGSLSATVARLRQELCVAKDDNAKLRGELFDAQNRLARLRAGGKG